MSCITNQAKALQQLSHDVFACKKCPLWRTRNMPLVGDGNMHSKIVFIGEAPGHNEDQQGKAFVGKSGAVLDDLLSHANLSKNDIYITNILKCHPPNNRNPLPLEINICVEYLYRQIKIIQPATIVTLGKFASQEFFPKVSLYFSKISAMHGKQFEIRASYGLVNVISLYHPSVACYNHAMLETLKKDVANALLHPS